MSDKPVVDPTKLDKITIDDLNVLKQANLNLKISTLELEKTHAKHQISEMSVKNVMLQIYLKYGIQADDKFNDADGSIERKKEEVKDNGK